MTRDEWTRETAMRRNFSLLRWFNWRDMVSRHRGLNYFVNAYYTRPRLNPVLDTWKELRALCSTGGRDPEGRQR